MWRLKSDGERRKGKLSEWSTARGNSDLPKFISLISLVSSLLPSHFPDSTTSLLSKRYGAASSSKINTTQQKENSNLDSGSNLAAQRPDPSGPAIPTLLSSCLRPVAHYRSSIQTATTSSHANSVEATECAAGKARCTLSQRIYHPLNTSHDSLCFPHQQHMRSSLLAILSHNSSPKTFWPSRITMADKPSSLDHLLRSKSLSNMAYTNCNTRIIDLKSLAIPERGTDSDYRQLYQQYITDTSEAIRQNANNLRDATESIKYGIAPPVAFPTETVYGLGADATNEPAVAGIFAAKSTAKR